MSARSKELALYDGTPGSGGATLYTVPSGKTAIVKVATVRNAAGLSCNYTLYLIQGGHTYYLWTNNTLAAYSTQVWTPLCDLVYPELIGIVEYTGAAMAVQLSGAELVT
jgi:hypothetical protein